MNRETRHPHILLIEDSEDDAFFFRYSMQTIGVPCTLAEVTDGTQAVDYLQSMGEGTPRAVPDLIFLDLKLPVYSGFDVLRWIRERAFQPALRIAILSGSDHEADINLARELGVIDYIVKPISKEELKKRILAVSGGEGEACDSDRVPEQSAA